MILIKNGLVIDPCSDFEEYADVLIKDDKVLTIGIIKEDELPFDTEIIDAKGMVVAPGLVDIHCHFRDPGFTHKEDILTGSKAALRGGFTSVVLMANTKPCVDNIETLSYIINKGKQTDLNIYSCATVSVGMLGNEITDMNTLFENGAIGFTDDGVPIMDEAVLTKAMIKTAELNVPISLHEEDPQFITNNGINKGNASDYFGIEGSPREAEITLIERDIELALETNAILNVQHISTKESVELIRKAKLKSNRIHAEATPHHFSLSEEAVIKHNTLAKMNPPLRTEEDRLAIIEGIKDGTIDIIATDHAPHTIEEKSQSIEIAPSGIIGLETSLSLGITNLVKPVHITMKELLTLMTYNPAKLYNVNAGKLSKGENADVLIFDPNESWEAGDYESKSSNTPFTGEKLYGVVKYTIVSGEVKYKL